MKIKILKSPKVEKTSFKGNPKYNLCVLNYLKNKYKDCCVIIPKFNKRSITHRDISLRWVQNDNCGEDGCNTGYFSIPNNYWKYFSKCKNKRFIIFPFGFDCSNFLGHANYMIYDRETKSLERFEPYGKTKRICTNPYNLDIKIKELFNKNLGKDFIKNYYKPLDFLKHKSFQNIQESEKEMIKTDPTGGFCSIWVCWYVDMRLSNPDINRKKLVSKAIKYLLNSDESLTKYIRNYSMRIVKYCKKIS